MPEELIFKKKKNPFCQRSLQMLLNAEHESNFYRLPLIVCFWFDQCHPVTAIINGKDSFNINNALYNIKDWKMAYLRQRCFKLQLLCALVSPFQNGERPLLH